MLHTYDHYIPYLQGKDCTWKIQAVYSIQYTLYYTVLNIHCSFGDYILNSSKFYSGLTCDMKGASQEITKCRKNNT